MRSRCVIIFGLFVVFSLACCALTAGTALAAGELMQKAQAKFEPIPSFPRVMEKNPLTRDKVYLGTVLYFDPRLSASMLISCNTCHNLGIGAADFQETSTGHRWQKGPRNAPTVFNSVFNIAQFWDGRAPDLKEQAKGPVQASVEMNNKPERVMETIKSMPEYTALFKAAFPADADPVTFENMAAAIEAFEATMITPDSRFDKFLKGDESALSDLQKEGLTLFLGKKCTTCHGGVNMGGADYFPFGLVEKPREDLLAGDMGRFKITGTKTDEYVFKAPSLRNIALTAPYFHSGKVWKLIEAVKVMGAAQLGIQLSDDDASKIAAFLHTTTGVVPRVEYPILPAPTDSTPKPLLD